MQQTINPAKQTVEACLKQRSYEIDFYQREYVWAKETVETLLKDIFYTFDLIEFVAPGPRIVSCLADKVHCGGKGTTFP